MCTFLTNCINLVSKNLICCSNAGDRLGTTTQVFLSVLRYANMRIKPESRLIDHPVLKSKLARGQTLDRRVVATRGAVCSITTCQGKRSDRRAGEHLVYIQKSSGKLNFFQGVRYTRWTQTALIHDCIHLGHHSIAVMTSLPLLLVPAFSDCGGVLMAFFGVIKWLSNQAAQTHG